MSRATEIPITPAVLAWAIDESGFTAEEIAAAVDVTVADLRRWQSSSDSKPNLTQTKKLAAKLHRPLATFLLPAPPSSKPLGVHFRHPADRTRDLNSVERRYLRRTARFQEILSWISAQLTTPAPNIPQASTNGDPGLIAAQVRLELKVSTHEQLAWQSSSVAFDHWRAGVEELGVSVFLFPMGKDSCQGFSMWDERVPVLAINTHWNEEARIFTLFHELGHLVTRTSSACLEISRNAAKHDPVERWCERFAAEVLLPRNDVEWMLGDMGWYPGRQITDITIAKRIAGKFKVSVRAAAIRLIELQAAKWQLYEDIPPLTDSKRGGGGGGGRSRTQIQEDRLGDRTTELVVSAVEKDVLDRWQAVELLDVPEVAFDEITKSVRRRA